MGLLKGAFFTACGALLVLFYREGHPILMNWTFVIWTLTIAWEFAKALTPYESTKKENQR